MNSLSFRSFVAAVLAVTTLPGQDQATPLATACDKADVIVVATVTVETDPSPEWHRLAFRLDEVLRGPAPSTFELMEPAGACCGRSLFALQPGDQRLLFLRRTGPVLHPFGGGRGVLPPTPTVLAHVRALLQAPDAAARVAVLLTGLDSAEPRVADDAAHALASAPNLRLDAAGRAHVADALAAAVDAGSTRAAALVDVALRSADAGGLDMVLDLYLATPRDDQARLLRTGLGRVSSAMLTARLPGLCRGQRTRELRGAELLCDIGDANANAALDGILTSTQCPRVQLCTVEGLLAAGAEPKTLRQRVPAAVLALAERRRNHPTFRAIRPDLR